MFKKKSFFSSLLEGMGSIFNLGGKVEIPKEVFLDDLFVSCRKPAAMRWEHQAKAIEHDWDCVIKDIRSAENSVVFKTFVCPGCDKTIVSVAKAEKRRYVCFGEDVEIVDHFYRCPKCGVEWSVEGFDFAAEVLRVYNLQHQKY